MVKSVASQNTGQNQKMLEVSAVNLKLKKLRNNIN
jgi:hypothetical protein